jgi:peptidoglycan/LPS O-acetylase OafA/YrhL/lysophospholipase L1-like esterase
MSGPTVVSDPPTVVFSGPVIHEATVRLPVVGTGGSHSRLGYAKGLDGVRALAVIAVLLYHLGTTGVLLGEDTAFMPGGFLGVDVFFVLSGFLITSLLLGERSKTGRISIRDFYIRRARRLLPALFTMMIVVAVASAFSFTAQAYELGDDLAAAFTYVTNWWLIAKESSYFGTGGHPPLLTHLWSLAVEEQFYLLWPLILIAVGGKALRERRAGLTLAAIAMIAGSTALAAMLFDPFADPSRVYYGTDTRAATPLVGAFLAIVLRPWRWKAAVTGTTRAVVDLAALAALGWLVLATLTVADSEPMLYRGGFLFVAIASGVLVIGAAHPSSRIGAALGIAPLRWLGERSYGIYLWHWPIFAVTQPEIDLPLDMFSSSVLRVGLTLIIADVSYRVVEKPLRAGAVGRAIARWRAAPRPRRRRQTMRTVAAAAVVLLAGTAVGLKLVAAKAPDIFVVGGDTLLGLGPPPNEPSVSPTATVIPTLLTVPPIPPKIALYGDSQGQSLLYYAPKDLGKYAKFSDHTIEGCGIALGQVVSSSGETRNLSNCNTWLSLWRERAATAKPDLAVVMLGAWDVFDLRRDTGTLRFGTPESDTYWIGQLHKGLDALEKSGTTVVLGLVPCFRPVAKNKGHGAGYWPERGIDARTRHLNDMIRDVAKIRQLHLLVPPEAYCTDPKVASDRSLRWDGVHFTPKGSQQYLLAILPQLLAMPFADGTP